MKFHGHGRGQGGRGYEGHGGGHRGRRHGDWAEREGGRGGRRRRVFDGSELRLVLLQLLSDEPRHGYELIRAIEELSGGQYVPSPGVVYPTLTMLHEMGQVEATGADGARRAYAVTSDGATQLATQKAEVEPLFARLAELAAVRARTDGGPLRRAMQNLRTVLGNRFERDEVAADTIHQAAAIIDDAAQRIERL